LDDVRKTLAYLEDENLRWLRQYKPANVEGRAVPPARQPGTLPRHEPQLPPPYASDRITVTDEWLNLPGQVDLKGNLVRFMDTFGTRTAQAIALCRSSPTSSRTCAYKPPKQMTGRD
jgi:hypothetical protein